MKISKNYIKDGIKRACSFIGQPYTEDEIENVYGYPEARKALIREVAQLCGTDDAFLQPEIINTVARLHGYSVQTFIDSVFSAYGEDTAKSLFFISNIQLSEENKFVLFNDDPGAMLFCVTDNPTVQSEPTPRNLLKVIH